MPTTQRRAAYLGNVADRVGEALAGHPAATRDAIGAAAADDPRIVGALQRSGGALTGPVTTAAGFRLPFVQPSSRRPMWRDKTYYREIFQTGHGWVVNGSGVASSNLNDTSSFVRGAQSVSVTSVGTTLGQTAGVRKTNIAGLSALDLTGRMFRLVLRVDAGVANIGALNVFLGNSGFTNFYKWVLTPVTSANQFVTEGQWVTVTFGWNDINSVSGTMTAPNGVPNTLTGFTDIQVQVSDTGTGPISLRVQAVEIIDAPAALYPKGVVSLTFDDSWDTQWSNARRVMDGFGFRGTMYTIADTVGTSGRVSLAQLRRMQDQSGWDIAGHAFTSAAHNARLPTMTAAQVDAELGNLKAWLLQNGFAGDTFAYPGGEFGPTTDGVSVEDIAARYFSNARSILAQPTKAIETFPPAMPWRMRCASSISSLNAANGLTQPAGIVAAGGILDKMAGGGGWNIMCFHEVTSGAPANTAQISVADFTTILQGIADRGIAVVPVSDVLRYNA